MEAQYDSPAAAAMVAEIMIAMNFGCTESGPWPPPSRYQRRPLNNNEQTKAKKQKIDAFDTTRDAQISVNMPEASFDYTIIKTL